MLFKSEFDASAPQEAMSLATIELIPIPLQQICLETDNF